MRGTNVLRNYACQSPTSTTANSLMEKSVTIVCAFGGCDPSHPALRIAARWLAGAPLPIVTHAQAI